MYFLDEGTETCGYYECKDCGQRFLDAGVQMQMVCPYCGEMPDMEIGPDDEMPERKEGAVLLDVIYGKDHVEMMDALLSLAITGGDYNWI